MCYEYTLQLWDYSMGILVVFIFKILWERKTNLWGVPREKL